LLRLDTALPVSPAFATTHRSPYAGSPGSLVGFAVDASGAPACELPFVSEERRWAVLTIGTGLGNASFTNKASPAE
jgi:hypothetical protein